MELAIDAEVTVIRSGGVAGIRRQATVAASRLDEHTRSALGRLLDAGGSPRSPGADRFVYEIVVRAGDTEHRCVAGEDARDAAEAVLRAERGDRP